VQFLVAMDPLSAFRYFRQNSTVPVCSNSNSLQSIIQAIGDWELDMLNFNSSPQRKLLVDLREPVLGSGPNGGDPIAPFDYQLVRGRLISKCTDFGNNMRNISGGATISCPLAIIR
jgi:hypothetical protein